MPDDICHWCHQKPAHNPLAFSFSRRSHPPDSFLKAVADHFPSPPVTLPDWSHGLLWINIHCFSYLLLPLSYLSLYITCPPNFLAWNSNIQVLKTHVDQECTCGSAGSSALEPVMVSRYPLGCPVGSNRLASSRFFKHAGHATAQGLWTGSSLLRKVPSPGFCTVDILSGLPWWLSW